MDDLNEFSHLTERLRALGDEPVEPTVRARHISQMAGQHREKLVPRLAQSRLFRSRLRVGAAFFAGLLIGGSGMAVAGALPSPAQSVAHDVLGAVGVGIPDGKGKPRSVEGCPEGQTFANHGQYMKWVAENGGDTEAASTSECGKPLKGEKPANAGPKEPGDRGNSAAAKADKGPKKDNPCRPPWAGGGPKPWKSIEDPAERQAAEDAAKAAFTKPAECDEDDDPEAEAAEDAAEAQREAEEDAAEQAEEEAEAQREAEAEAAEQAEEAEEEAEDQGEAGDDDPEPEGSD